MWERMNNVEIYRIILEDKRALFDSAFPDGNEKQRERNVSCQPSAAK